MKFLLLSLFISSQIFAATTNCTCTGTDSMAKASCGPMPKKMNKNLFTETEFCPAPGIAGAGAAAAKTVTQTVAALDIIKTPKQTLDYFSCYRVNNSQFCHYQKTVGPLIHLAAQSSDLPFAVQACLFNRESGGFKPNQQKREGGAMGYVQFMPATLPGIKNILYTSVAAMTKEHDARESEITSNEKLLTHHQDKTSKAAIALRKKINGLETKNDLLYSKIAAKQAWDEYWAGTTPPNISGINQNSLNCPQIAFALAAVVQTRSLHTINKIKVRELKVGKNKNAISINGMNAMDSAILLAGAYNLGPGGLASKCGSVKSLQECINKFPVGTETWGHLNSIRNCAKKDSFDAPSFKNGKPANKDCKASQCS